MRRFCRSSLAIAGFSLASLLSVTALSAHAQQTQYLLQFGQHESEAAARKQWDDLKQKHANLLQNKQLRVAEVTVSGGMRYRTQASGVAGREEAIQTCNSLNLQDVTCMVVETSMVAPATQAENAPLTVEIAQAETPSAAPFFLPWINKKEETAQEPEEKTLVSTQTVTIEEQPAPTVMNAPVPTPPPPVIVEEAVPAEQPVTIVQAPVPATPAPVPPAAMDEPVQAQPVMPVAQQPVTRIVPERAPKNLAAITPQTPTAAAPVAEETTAVVEVAEAIPVPLSYNNFAPVKTASRPVGYGGYPSQNLPNNAPWLQIGPFRNKDAAMGYWRNLAQQNPEMMRLLRVKITGPLNNRYGMARTFLRFGPFQDQGSINFLCQKAVKEGLQCKGVKEMGGSIARTPAAPRYQQRQLTRNQTLGLSASQATQNKVAGMYYLQLGAMSSAQEAKQRWEQLATVHKDLLGQLQPQVSYPSRGNQAQPVYFLRTGPFVTAESAAQLCNRLKSRHLGCIIIQAR